MQIPQKYLVLEIKPDNPNRHVKHCCSISLELRLQIFKILTVQITLIILQKTFSQLSNMYFLSLLHF